MRARESILQSAAQRISVTQVTCICAAICVPLAGCGRETDGDPLIGISSDALVSSAQSYILPTSANVSIRALLTAGDSVNAKPDGTPYRMAGIPDGLGAYDNRDGTFTVLMNHEFTNTVGTVRAHGASGAFVSKWTVDKSTLDILHGEDLIQSVRSFDKGTGTWAAPAAGVAFSRLCSADLPEKSALYDARSRKGYLGRIFLNGEESGAEGRAMGHVVTGAEAGVSYELPHLGRMAFENVVANPKAGGKTIVALTDDGTGGQIYVYIGEKTRVGSPVDRAGLTNGTLFGIKVEGVSVETDATVVAANQAFALVALGNVSGATGAQVEAASVAAGVTTFQRPEDSAWNPKQPNQLFFVTTASFTSKTRLWRLNFNKTFSAGTIDLLVDGGEARMFDNITVSNDGRYVILQEDPGNQDHLASIWRYTIKTGKLEKIGVHDSMYFGIPAGASFITRDEESSGVIDVSRILGRGTYLLADQLHTSAGDSEIVEKGQLQVMKIGCSDESNEELADDSDD